jgi:hypothetical protein
LNRLLGRKTARLRTAPPGALKLAARTAVVRPFGRMMHPRIFVRSLAIIPAPLLASWRRTTRRLAPRRLAPRRLVIARGFEDHVIEPLANRYASLPRRRVRGIARLGPHAFDVPRHIEFHTLTCIDGLGSAACSAAIRRAGDRNAKLMGREARELAVGPEF